MTYPLTHKQFYEGLKAGRLQGLKCKACGAVTAPPKICCAECGATELEVILLSGRGKIKTYTVIRVAPEEFNAPYIVAMTELDEGPWVMGNVEGIDLTKPVGDLTGTKVRCGCRIVPPAKYTGGEGVVLTFSPA